MSLESPSKRRLATRELEASVGWYGSQNTYFDLFGQNFDRGLHGTNPPNLPDMKQQAEFAFSKPVIPKKKKKNQNEYYSLELIVQNAKYVFFYDFIA